MLRFKLKERIADKEFKEGRRISLSEVADTTGIGRITLSRMLNRGTNVRSDTLDRLCAYFDCRIEDLVEYVPDDAAAQPGTTTQQRG
ncbi:helix-turn-helix transcriptional regulator [Luteimonas yindakuii]|uniref:helix-turn-helix domain-containing protein n=1 Tax=Luteimonas yindakuii TaxID=2565782 RepID=UPI0010A33AB1|nr:helix-turn-helix transcriptional regulator [Luteimonas yindakuii]QCO67001.1 helix-turn-helix transcriptional regulator [Luteimonas yindakuii]